MKRATKERLTALGIAAVPIAVAVPVGTPGPLVAEVGVPLLAGIAYKLYHWAQQPFTPYITASTDGTRITAGVKRRHGASWPPGTVHLAGRFRGNPIHATSRFQHVFAFDPHHEDADEFLAEATATAKQQARKLANWEDPAAKMVARGQKLLDKP